MRKQKNSELDNLCLRYKVKDYPGFENNNKENYEKLHDALADVGVRFSIDDGLLTIYIYNDKYERVKTRNAGPRHKLTIKNRDTYEVYHYSDIVYMMQTMSAREIYENQIHMAEATFFRHKKMLLDSLYYKSLDKNRLKDLEYLESVDGNFAF